VYYNGKMNANGAGQRIVEVVRPKHLALATESNYRAWLDRYCHFVEGLPLHWPSEHELEQFLMVLARKHVLAGTQNQAQSLPCCCNSSRSRSFGKILSRGQHIGDPEKTFARR